MNVQLLIDSRVMKRIIILFVVTLLSVVNVSAKTVRGYVSDRDGKPVSGLRIVVVNEEQPRGRCITATDAEGYFCVQVPDDMDTSDLLSVITKQGAKILDYRCDWHGALRITMEVKTPEREEALVAQK